MTTIRYMPRNLSIGLGITTDPTISSISRSSKFFKIPFISNVDDHHTIYAQFAKPFLIVSRHLVIFDGFPREPFIVLDRGFRDSCLVEAPSGIPVHCELIC